MKKTQKFIVRERGLEEKFFVISEDSEDITSPLFCEICKFVMNRAEDSDCYDKFKCCYECTLKFAQPMQDRWSNGWRTKKRDIEKHKAEIESRQRVLFFSHDN